MHDSLLCVLGIYRVMAVTQVHIANYMCNDTIYFIIRFSYCNKSREVCCGTNKRNSDNIMLVKL